MAGIYDLPGQSGQSARRPNGALWYSPVQVTNPDFTRTTREAVAGVADALKALSVIQKTTVDVLAPVLESFNRKADLMESAVSFLKNFVDGALGQVSEIVARTGVYVLITMPNLKVRRYVWVPATRILSQATSVEEDPALTFGVNVGGQNASLSVGGGSRAEVVVDRDGGFYAVDDAQWERFLAGQVVEVSTGRGTKVRVDRRVTTTMLGVGSDGVAGFLEKFDASFRPVGNVPGGATKAGERSDLCIPKFEEGDVVAGMTLLVQAPGFNDLLDSMFRTANLFVPGNSLRRMLREFVPDLTAQGAALDALRRTKLDVAWETPYLTWKNDDGPDDEATRDEIRDAIDFDDDEAAFQITSRTRQLGRLRGWRITFWLKVDQIVSDDDGNFEEYDYRGAPLVTPAENARWAMLGFHKVAVIHSRNLVGETGLPETEGPVTDKAFHADATIVNDGGARRTGTRLPLAPKQWDARWGWRVTLEGLYNRDWTPTAIVGESIAAMIEAYPELETMVPVGAILDGESAVDVVVGREVRGFDEIGGNLVSLETLGAFEGDGFATLRTTVTTETSAVLSSAYQTAAVREAGFLLEKVGFDTLLDQETTRSLSLDVAREIYLQMKLGPNPRNNYWIDEIEGKSLYRAVEAKTEVQASERDRLGIESGWQAVDVASRSFLVPAPPRSGQRSFLAKATHGRSSSRRNDVVGFGVPDFRLDRWFCANVDAWWPDLREFVDRFREFSRSLDLTFPTLRSPYLDFVNGILDDVNKVVGRINGIIEAIDAVLETVEIVSGEGVHVLRLEDELGKGYVTGGNAAIRRIVREAPGLPEYLRDESEVVRASNIDGAGIAGRGNRPALFDEAGGRVLFPAEGNIEIDRRRDDFVASITILAGGPVIEDAYATYRNAVRNTLRRARAIDPSILAERERLTAQLTANLAAASATEASRNTLRATIENAQSIGLSPDDVAGLQAQADALDTQLDRLASDRESLEGRIDEIDGRLATVVDPEIEERDTDAAERRQARLLAAPFDFMERTIFGTSGEDKREQAEALL